MPGRAFEDELHRDLSSLEGQARLRRLHAVERSAPHLLRDGRRLANLASNDYLGLSQHRDVIRAVREAAERFGVGAGASRLVSGSLHLHAELEARFARLKHAPAGLMFPTGYMANLAVLTSLAGPGDLVCQDRLNHASLIDAARLSGAEVRTFPHRRLDRLDRLLARHERLSERPPMGPADASGDHPRRPRRFIVTDSVFSMDGDVADLPGLAEAAERRDAVLVIDEAHATGVLGESGAGLAEQQGATDRVDISISTGSKALGGLGGVVCASQVVIDTLVNRGRSFIYTTAAPPIQAAGLLAALDVVDAEPVRRRRLSELSCRVREGLLDQGWSMPETSVVTPILPLIVGDDSSAMRLADHLTSHGLLGVAIRPPTVPPGQARVRLSLRCDLDDADIRRLLDATAAWVRLGR